MGNEANQKMGETWDDEKNCDHILYETWDKHRVFLVLPLPLYSVSTAIIVVLSLDSWETFYGELAFKP